LVFPVVSFLLVFPPISYMHSSSSSPPQFVLHVLPISSFLTWSWSSSLCSLLQPPVTSSLFGPNILLNALFSNTLSVCSSLNVTYLQCKMVVYLRVPKSKWTFMSSWMTPLTSQEKLSFVELVSKNIGDKYRRQGVSFSIPGWRSVVLLSFFRKNHVVLQSLFRQMAR
jgi:hypothetical protein